MGTTNNTRQSVAAELAKHRRNLAINIHRLEDGRPLDFNVYGWALDPLSDPSPEILMSGEVQAGRTEALLCHAFASAMMGMKVVYAMPKRDDVERLRKCRIEPLLNTTPLYQKARVRRKDTSSRIIHIGDGTITLAALSATSELPHGFDSLAMDLQMQPPTEAAERLYEGMVASPFAMAMVASFFGAPRPMRPSCHYLWCPPLHPGMRRRTD